MNPILSRFAAALLGLLACAGPARADLGFPDTVKLPPQIAIDPDQKLQEEAVGAFEFITSADGSQTREIQGRHFTRWFAWRPAKGEPAPGYDNGTEGRITAAMQSALAAAGWQPVFTDDNKSHFVMRQTRNGREAWLDVRMDAPQAQVHLELVEQGTATRGFAVPAPAAKPETIADAADIPYLPPWPGAKRDNGGRGNTPMDITRPGSGEEARLVGNGTFTRVYMGPPTLSQRQFIGDYRAALLAAGWDIAYPDEKDIANYGSLVAHYTKDGRDIWAKLSYTDTAKLWYEVADAGADDLAAKLQKDCRLPLYGVFFDFDKATLKPESNSVLTRVAAMLAAHPDFKVEIQGHTDNVGTDAYNLKLSDDRAASVRLWLTQHGLAADRITSKGYGKSRPIADNASDAGRARNRRVELVRQGCK